MNEKQELAQQEQQLQSDVTAENTWNWPYRHDPRRHKVPKGLRWLIYALTPFVIIPGTCLVFGAFYLCHRLLYTIKFNAIYRDMKTEDELKEETMWFNVTFLLVLTVLYCLLR